jgi:MoxR-vWA-beta-propeller ternary system domain bpX2
LIYQLHIKDKDALGTVRCVAGLLVATDQDDIWLRYDDVHGAIPAALRKLPVLATFETDEEGHLFHLGCQTPVMKLKTLEWMALTDFLPLKMPVAALPGLLGQPQPIPFVISQRPRKGKALLTSLDVWKKYAAEAPAIRLEMLRFAVSAKGEVLVIGDILPPLPGKEYWEVQDIYIPAGFDFENEMFPVFLHQQLNPLRRQVLVFDQEGNWQAIDKNYFVTAKRSAVRLTGLPHD